MAWLSDDPIRPMPINATRSNIGRSGSYLPPHKLSERRHHGRLSSSVPMVMRRQLGKP
jgi:hypothetical protein